MVNGQGRETISFEVSRSKVKVTQGRRWIAVVTVNVGLEMGVVVLYIGLAVPVWQVSILLTHLFDYVWSVVCCTACCCMLWICGLL